jgi:hypothetical protein
MSTATPTGSTPAQAAPVTAVQDGSATGSLGGGRPILTPGYLQAHRVGIPNAKDVIWAPLYDFNAYPSTGPAGNQLSFFAQQQGQGSSSAPGVGAGVPKGVFDTNMQAPNVLFLGNEFYCIGSETLFFPGVTTSTTTPFGIEIGRTNATTTIGEFVNDVWAMGLQGFKQLKVGTDRYYIQDGPLSLFPPCTKMHIAAAVAGYSNTNTGGEIAYGAWGGEAYTIVPVYIQTTQVFTVTYLWPTVLALPSGVGARIGERLRGYLIRQAT